MAVDLGEWGWAAELAIDWGLTPLATAFGVPGPASAFVVKTLKSVLGLKPSASAEDVQATVEGMDPSVAKAAFESTNSEAVAKYEYLGKVAEIQGRVAETSMKETGKTMRAEIGVVPWWHWRHQIGNVVAFEIFIFPIAALLTIIFGDAEKTKAMIDYSGQLTIILGIASGLLGVVAINNTTRAAAAINGEAPETIASKVVKAVLPKKR